MNKPERANATLTVFGTGSQIPTPQRGHPGAFLAWHGLGILIDPGETTQLRYNLAGVPPSRTDLVFVSHLHGDHCLGLPGIMQTLTWHERTDILKIFCPPGGAGYLRNLLSGIIWHSGFDYEITEVESGKFHQHGPLELAALPLEHEVPVIGLRVTERDRWRLDPKRIQTLGLTNSPELKRLAAGQEVAVNDKTYRPQDVGTHRPGPVFAYVPDTRKCENALLLAEDASLLLIESTYLEQHREQAADHMHLTAKQAADIALRAGVGQVILTHFSNRYPDAPEQAGAEAGQVHPNVIAARDGDVFEF